MNISEFTLDAYLQNHLTIGKLVYFIDNSYVTDKNGNRALPTFDPGLEVFKIIDSGKAFPTAFSALKNACSPINNRKVQNITTGKIYHCSNINVVSICSSELDGEQSVIYNGKQTKVSEVFSNPFPFL